jgi:Anti-sigma regulatory factor (Ser/Thr protein kinase)
MQLESRSVHDEYARTALSAVISQLDPTTEELIDIRTSVIDAGTNCILHGY